MSSVSISRTYPRQWVGHKITSIICYKINLQSPSSMMMIHHVTPSDFHSVASLNQSDEAKKLVRVRGFENIWVAPTGENPIFSLKNCSFPKCIFQTNKKSNCIFPNCIFPNCIFPNCIFPNCIFPNCILSNCIFSKHFLSLYFSRLLFSKLYFSKLYFPKLYISKLHSFKLYFFQTV